MNLRIADLHTHSSHSDGSCRPAELVRLAAGAGVSALALTDHDTVQGNEEAAASCAGAGIHFVPGIEISALHDGLDFHILGYCVHETPGLRAYVEMMETRRTERLVEIAARLGDAGLTVDVGRIQESAAGLATRAHVASYLVREGIVGSVREAFAAYLGPGCVANVPAGVLSVAEAIDLIHRSGGCASLAHPGDWTGEATIRFFRRQGLDAVEAVHPSHDERLTAYYTGLASEMGLLVTGGSDFHQPGGDVTSPGTCGVDVDRLHSLLSCAAAYREDYGLPLLNQTPDWGV